MLQIIQHLSDGRTEAIDVPRPTLRRGHVLVRTRCSLISAGTERMLVEFGRSDLMRKAMAQPERVRQVIDKARTDGVINTLASVRSKLDTPLPLGYCNVGEVIGVGEGVVGLGVGDRVASNGPHAEIVCVPRNLCVRIPDAVSDDAAAFVVPAAIGLQGLRLAQPTLGERFVVTGLGLIGLLTVQLLRAHGASVLGIDYDPSRCARAREAGATTVDLSHAEDPLAAAEHFSQGRGVDGVILTAATRSSEPIAQAAKMCRRRGRIVLVGVTGLELSRDDFYAKEISFQVSCSYGPGRYDRAYEEGGHDYPFGLVRWTEQRNFEAVLDLVADARLAPASLITHRFAVAEAAKAYDSLVADKSALGILLTYPAGDAVADRASGFVAVAAPRTAPARGVVAVIGAGNYASRVLIPALAKTGARLKTIVTTGGVNGAHAARKFGFEQVTTDLDATLQDPEIDTCVIATRHASHAPLACRALEHGKHVFVEKPLAIDTQGLDDIAAAYEDACTRQAVLLAIGFNRRFAPQVVEMRRLLRSAKGPKTIVVTVNAGALPPEHWTLDPLEGGGRIVGEACHFIDLARCLAAAPITGVDVVSQRDPVANSTSDDTASIALRFADGSIASIHYLANGHRSFPKERIEVFGRGRVLQLDNFRRLQGYGWPHVRGRSLWRQDKGNDACIAAFMDAVRSGGDAPVPFDEIMEVSRASVRAAEAVSRQ